MERKELLQIASELMGLLNEKQLTPTDAENVVAMLDRYTEKSIDESVKEFKNKTGIFLGKVPEN